MCEALGDPFAFDCGEVFDAGSWLTLVDETHNVINPDTGNGSTAGDHGLATVLNDGGDYAANASTSWTMTAASSVPNLPALPPVSLSEQTALLEAPGSAILNPAVMGYTAQRIIQTMPGKLWSQFLANVFSTNPVTWTTTCTGSDTIMWGVKMFHDQVPASVNKCHQDVQIERPSLMTVEDCKPWRYHFGCDNQGWVQNYILAGPDEMLPELFFKDCLCCLRV